MAVITQFVVVREGVEKMTFTSKKEADAYDKMLDIADNLIPFIQKAELGIDESLSEQLAFYFANHKDELTNLLKGVVPVNSTASKPNPAKKVPKKDTADE
ncbi:YebG family protein [Shewanella acanthi]|uniref:YebG family protein n=1 Tax=Shewanella acanthi TaxID=2864212 RepID=UPI001C65BFCC|nr:YebG family protein [Shewanella acanthi]MCH1931238.1 YebG family protein [Shewanella shenzhenensis]QYJ80251.1 YebG family protein [Shewanella acanthi]